MVVVCSAASAICGAPWSAALTLGIVNKFLEPVAGAVLGKIVVLVLLILFIQRRPRGMFPLKGGRAVESMMMRTSRPAGLATLVAVHRAFRAADVGAEPGDRIRPTAFHVPTYVMVSLVGKYLCFAMLALAVDLVWGYVGILTPRPCRVLRPRRLRHGHVPDARNRHARRLRQPGPAGFHGVPELDKELPWYLVRVQQSSLVRHA